MQEDYEIAIPDVEELLEQQRLEHVSRFLATEKCLNAVFALQQQKDQLLETSGRKASFESDVKAQEVMNGGSHENSDPQSTTKLDAHQRLHNMEILYFGEEAAYEASCAIVEKMQITKSRFERDLRVLKEKFQRIQQLGMENKERQELCQELLKFNANSKEKFGFQDERSEVLYCG